MSAWPLTAGVHQQQRGVATILGQIDLCTGLNQAVHHLHLVVLRRRKEVEAHSSKH